MTVQCLIDHIVLNVEDDVKMLAFYSNVLMLEPERADEYAAGNAPFPSVRLNPVTVIDLFPKTMWEGVQAKGQRNLNHFCLSLKKADWQKLLDRLKANAVAIEEGPVRRWGAQGDGTSIYFRDPEENLIEARYYDE
ncbi:MAG: VOC family protein [Gammaproteobacteria bacterium]